MALGEKKSMSCFQGMLRSQDIIYCSFLGGRLLLLRELHSWSFMLQRHFRESQRITSLYSPSLRISSWLWFPRAWLVHAPQHQPLEPEDFQTTLKGLCPSPLYQRGYCSAPHQTLGQAAPKCLQLLSSKSYTSRAPMTTSSIYLEFWLAFLRCRSFTSGNTHTTSEYLCAMVWCGGLDAAWQPEWAAVETLNLLPLL